MRPAPLRPAQEVGRPSLPHSSWSRTVTFSSRQISLLPVRVLLVRPVAASRCLRLPEMTSDTQKITRCIGCWNSHFSKSIWAQSGDVLLSIFVLHCMKHWKYNSPHKKGPHHLQRDFGVVRLCLTPHIFSSFSHAFFLFTALSVSLWLEWVTSFKRTFLARIVLQASERHRCSSGRGNGFCSRSEHRKPVRN